MKKINQVILYLFIGFLVSCTGPVEPFEWSTYFVFVNQDNSDFFDSNLDYDPSGIVMVTNGIGFIFHLDTLSSINRFRRGSALWDVQYIDYGNGDLDTLRMEWSPPEVIDVYFAKGEHFGSVDNIKFFLNDLLVEEWDFVKDPGLRMRIVRSNTDASKNDADFDPVIIVLPKEPDLDELD